MACLDQPFSSTRDFAGRKGKGLAQGIERLFQSVFESRLFLDFSFLPTQSAQARAQHRERRIGRRPEGKHHQGDGQKQYDCQC